MLLGYLGFSGLAHPVKAEQPTTEQEWQIDFPLHANSSRWVAGIWSIEKGSMAALGFNRSGFRLPPGVFPRCVGAGEEGLRQVLPPGRDSKIMTAGREPWFKPSLTWFLI